MASAAALLPDTASAWPSHAFASGILSNFFVRRQRVDGFIELAKAARGSRPAPGAQAHVSAPCRGLRGSAESQTCECASQVVNSSNRRRDPKAQRIERAGSIAEHDRLRPTSRRQEHAVVATGRLAVGVGRERVAVPRFRPAQSQSSVRPTSAMATWASASPLSISRARFPSSARPRARRAARRGSNRRAQCGRARGRNTPCQNPDRAPASRRSGPWRTSSPSSAGLVPVVAAAQKRLVGGRVPGARRFNRRDREQLERQRLRDSEATSVCTARQSARLRS